MKTDEARAKIDAFISAENAAETDHTQRMLIAWSRREGDEDESALITFRDKDVWDVELTLVHVEEKGGPSVVIELAAVFEQANILPQENTRGLFNLMEALRPGMRFHLHPLPPDRHSSLARIAVIGVEAVLWAETLSPDHFVGTIDWLLISANAALRILNGNGTKKDDAWGRLLPRRKRGQPGDE